MFFLRKGLDEQRSFAPDDMSGPGTSEAPSGGFGLAKRHAPDHTPPDPYLMEEFMVERAAHRATINLALAVICMLTVCACQMQEDPLVRAAKDGDLAGVERLIKAGHNIDASAEKGVTALTWAAFGGHEKIVRSLVTAGANVNSADTQGWTPLMVASELGYSKIMKILLEAGADVHAKTADGKTALSLAVQRRRSEEEALLKQYGAPR